MVERLPRAPNLNGPHRFDNNQHGATQRRTSRPDLDGRAGEPPVIGATGKRTSRVSPRDLSVERRRAREQYERQICMGSQAESARSDEARPRWRDGHLR